MNAPTMCALGCGHFTVANLPVAKTHVSVASTITASHDQVLCGECKGYHQVLRSAPVVLRGYTRARYFKVTPAFMRNAREPQPEPPAVLPERRGYQREVFKPKVMGSAGFFKT
jgi:alanine dehydrogenase